MNKSIRFIKTEPVTIWMGANQMRIYISGVNTINGEINRSASRVLRLIIAADMSVIFETPGRAVDIKHNSIHAKLLSEVITAILYQLDSLPIHRIETATTSTG
jgi:hypothetical protein